MISFRNRNLTEIEYILVAKKQLEGNTLLTTPYEFRNNVLDFIKHSPKDILQLQDSFNYFYQAKSNHFLNPINFSVTYDKDFKFIYKNIFLKSDLTKVFFLENDISDFENIISCKREVTMYKKWQIRMYQKQQIRMSIFSI